MTKIVRELRRIIKIQETGALCVSLLREASLMNDFDTQNWIDEIKET